MTGARVRGVDLGSLLIVLLAFGVRLYGIDRQDIWGDEAFSIWLSGQPIGQVLAGGADTHPPLYPFFLHLWLRLAGSSSLATRALSALIGTLTVPVVYLLGRRAFGLATGRLAALLAAVSPVLVYYSQETRMYGLVALLAAASVYWAMRLPRASRAGAWLGYLVTTLSAAYTHYYAFFVILAENLILIPFLVRHGRRTALRRWLAAQGVILLAYIPWIWVQTGFLSGKASTRFEEWTLAWAGEILQQTLTSLAAGLALSPAPAWTITALFLFAILAGLPGLVRRRRPEPWLVVSYLATPLLLAWVVNPIMPFFFPRYLLLIAPAFLTLSAWGVMAWRGQSRPLATLGALLLLAGSFYGLFGYFSGDQYVKGRYGEMMAYVEASAQPGDGLILANQLQRPIFQYYQPDGLEAYYFPPYDYPLEDPRTARDLESIADQHARLWLVRFGNPAEYDPTGYLDRWLASRGSKAYFEGWVDADLSLYVMNPAGSSDSDIDHSLRADLGGAVRLLGYRLSARELAPGDSLLLSLHWQALAPMVERYTVFTHLLDAKGHLQAQMDSEPLGGGLPTDRWSVGQVVQDNYALVIPKDAPPGSYTIEVGMYRLETLERLPVRDTETGADQGDRVLLGSIEVVGP